MEKEKERRKTKKKNNIVVGVKPTKSKQYYQGVNK